MDEALLITIILAAVVGANILTRHISSIPTPFFLIGMGIILSFLPIYHGFNLDPSVFTLAIIAPLLFNEAQNSSRLWIGRSISTILSLAVGLVVVTVLIVGAGLHFLYPAIPISLAFALMAIVTPTDAAAVNSIFETNPIAEDQAGTLQNESLFNDAAGIVLFDVALTAYISGSFKIDTAIGLFLWEFFGGLIFGGLLGVIIVSIRLFLVRHNDDTPVILVTIQILTPFLVYLLAEKIALSGILAVVAAGLAQGAERDRLRLTSSRMQIVTSNVWEILSGLLSGIVFVLLGLSLINVVQAVHKSINPDFSLFKMTITGISLYFAQLLVRLLWSHYLVRNSHHNERSWKDSLVMALSGAHGTITLSLAFSLPVFIGGTAFEMRGSLIYMAAIIILLSLIMPTLFVPLLLPSTDPRKHRFQWVRRMIQAAITDLLREEEHKPEAQIVIDSLEQQLILDAIPKRRIQRRLMNETLEVETKAIDELHNQGKITDEEHDYYIEFIQINNFSADGQLWRNIWLRLRFSFHIGRTSRDFGRAQDTFLTTPVELEEAYWRDQFQKHGEDILPVEQVGFNAVMNFLRTNDSTHGVESNFVKRFYRTRHRRMNSKDADPEIVYQMFMRAFHSEYELIQNSLIEGKIDSPLAERLQQRISFDEINYIQNIEVFRY